MLVDLVGQRLFRFVHDHHLVYAMCWEDPRVDRAALGIGRGDRLLAITSAGCNVLDYLLEEPASIDAVDLNHRQNALLALKLAAIAELKWNEFFAMFGEGRHPSVRSTYYERLRRRLMPCERRFWDRHIGLFCGRAQFYHRTTSGWFAAWFCWYIRCVLRLEAPVLRLLAAQSVAEQREIYDRHVRDRFWKNSLAFFLRRDAVLALSGIPPEQRRQIQRDQPDLLAYLRGRAEQVIYHLPLAENYFWRAYLTGSFTRSCAPRYLQPSNFEQLRSLRHRIHCHTNSVAEFLASSSQNYTHFVLLDHMDWLAGRRLPELAAEWQAIVDRAVPGAKILWRSLAQRTDYLERIDVRVRGRVRPLREVLRYNRALAAELREGERVTAYGNLSIATYEP